MQKEGRGFVEEEAALRIGGGGVEGGPMVEIGGGLEGVLGVGEAFGDEGRAGRAAAEEHGLVEGGAEEIEAFVVVDDGVVEVGLGEEKDMAFGAADGEARFIEGGGGKVGAKDIEGVSGGRSQPSIRGTALRGKTMPLVCLDAGWVSAVAVGSEPPYVGCYGEGWEGVVVRRHRRASF